MLRISAIIATATAVGCAVALWRRRRRPHLRLTYLNVKSYGEPIRLALTIAGIPFEDRRVDYEKVYQLRKEGILPYGQVPMLEIDGAAYGQSSALLRYVGIRAGLYPNELQLQIDGVEAALDDIKRSLFPQWFKHSVGRDPDSGLFYDATALTNEQLVLAQHHHLTGAGTEFVRTSPSHPACRLLSRRR